MRPYRNILPWIIASAAAFLIINYSYVAFAATPLLDSGSKVRIRYGCTLGEGDSSIIFITGESYYRKDNLTENLCVLKDLPMAASGLSGNQILTFIVYEIILAGSFALSRLLSRLLAPVQ